MSIINKTKQEIIKEFAKDGKNTGLTEVQVALMSKQIANLTGHLKTHSKDHSSRRSLLILVGKRRRLLDYLKKHFEDRYKNVIEKLDLRK